MFGDVILKNFYDDLMDKINCNYTLYKDNEIYSIGIATIQKNCDLIHIEGELNLEQFKKTANKINIQYTDYPKAYKCILYGFPRIKNNEKIYELIVEFPKMKLYDEVVFSTTSNKFYTQIIPELTNGEKLHLEDLVKLVPIE